MVTFKHVGAAVVAGVFAIAITIDTADARRGGGGGARAGGFGGGGGMRAANFRGGASGLRAGGVRGGIGNRPHVSQPIAGIGNRPGGPGWGNRPGGPGWGNRPGWGGNPGWAGRPGWGYGPGYGWGWGAAAAGAAVGAGLAYSNCYDGSCGGYYNADYYASSSGATSDAVAWCAQRFRSYDMASQTYLAKGGRRVPCP